MRDSCYHFFYGPPTQKETRLSNQRRTQLPEDEDEKIDRAVKDLVMLLFEAW